MKSLKLSLPRHKTRQSVGLERPRVAESNTSFMSVPNLVICLNENINLHSEKKKKIYIYIYIYMYMTSYLLPH